MVDTLNLPLDLEEDNLNENVENQKDDVMEEGKQGELDKSRIEDEEDQPKVDEENTITVTSAFELSHLSNKLILGKIL